MTFDKQKQQVLSRLDKSKKGSIDKDIKSLVNIINSLSDYYTSSSCSGRISITEVTGKKQEYNWLFVTHSKANFNHIKKTLEQPQEKNLWLKHEPMILHICCRDIDSAKKMLDICHDAGLKRAGIITFGKKIMIETFGTDKMDVPISEKGNLLVNEVYLKVLIREANGMHEKNLARIERLYKKIKDIKNK